MSIKTHLSALIQLAAADEDFATKEKDLIYLIGKANGVKKEDIDELMSNPAEMDSVSTLSDDEKFELLYNVVQLMKIDNEIFLSEIRFCEDIATKLGFSRKVIAELSANIYADPSITSDRELLKSKVMKYKE